ncbi:MAG TPA: hypothetical protein DCW29_11090 [Janthinobacterium sp.]|nr:hypothetical protein [Janthinobacterium sp.]
MEKTPIPDEVQRFILLAIPSVPYLEAILLMRGGPGLTWDVAQIARRLYLSDKVAKGLLADLTAGGIARREPQMPNRFRFAPQSAQLVAMIDQLAAAYSQNLIGVSTLIHSKTNRKAQLFADAFVWKKER